MTEIQEVYFDDIREKKSIKNSAMKKNRTGKGPIRFQTDYMTKKEREAMNGECQTWDLKTFYTWSEFRSMPSDIQIAWINRMLTVYNVGLSTIGEHLYDKPNKFHSYLKDHPEIKKYINCPRPGGRHSKSVREKFINDVNIWKNGASSDLAINETAKETIEAATSQPITMSDICFTMDGFDMDFLNIVKEKFGNQSIRVNITVFVNNKNIDI